MPHNIKKHHTGAVIICVHPHSKKPKSQPNWVPVGPPPSLGEMQKQKRGKNIVLSLKVIEVVEQG